MKEYEVSYFATMLVDARDPHHAEQIVMGRLADDINIVEFDINDAEEV